MLKYLILLCDFIWWPLQLIWKQVPSTCSVHAQQVLNICIDIGYLHDVNHAYKHLMMKLAKKLCWNGMWFHTTDKSGRTCLSSNRTPTFTAGYMFVQEALHSTNTSCVFGGTVPRGIKVNQMKFYCQGSSHINIYIAVRHFVHNL